MDLYGSLRVFAKSCKVAVSLTMIKHRSHVCLDVALGCSGLEAGWADAEAALYLVVLVSDHRGELVS